MPVSCAKQKVLNWILSELHRDFGENLLIWSSLIKISLNLKDSSSAVMAISKGENLCHDHELINI